MYVYKFTKMFIRHIKKSMTMNMYIDIPEVRIFNTLQLMLFLENLFFYKILYQNNSEKIVKLHIYFQLNNIFIRKYATKFPSEIILMRNVTRQVCNNTWQE